MTERRKERFGFQGRLLRLCLSAVILAGAGLAQAGEEELSRYRKQIDQAWPGLGKKLDIGIESGEARAFFGGQNRPNEILDPQGTAGLSVA